MADMTNRQPDGAGRAYIRAVAAAVAAAGRYPSIVAVAEAAGRAERTVAYHRTILIGRGEWPAPARGRGRPGRDLGNHEEAVQC
jgi:hypothetical protein